MDNGYVFPSYQVKELPKKDNQQKKAIVLILLTFGLVIFGVGIFYLGKESAQDNTQSPALLTDPGEKPENQYQTPSNTNPKITPPGDITTTPPPTQGVGKSEVITSEKKLDGFRSSNDTGYSYIDIRVGRNQTLVTRGFLSFDISQIPSDAIITEATIRLFKVRQTGDPIKEGGTIEIDHLIYGDSLDELDFDIPAILSGFSTLKDSKTKNYMEADVTLAIQNDLNTLKSQSQFRIHLRKEEKGDDVEGDYFFFESADNSEGTDNIPQLIVKYN